MFPGPPGSPQPKAHDGMEVRDDAPIPTPPAACSSSPLLFPSLPSRYWSLEEGLVRGSGREGFTRMLAGYYVYDSPLFALDGGPDISNMPRGNTALPFCHGTTFC